MDLSSRRETGHPVPHAWFRKVVTLDPSKIASAGLQVHGDTHVKIYVNGKPIGEQFARNFRARVKIRSCSPCTIFAHTCANWRKRHRGRRANTARINPRPRAGGPAGSGGFHLYGEIRDQGGRVQPILSDTSWKVSDRELADWNQPEFDDHDWPTASPTRGRRCG